MNCKHETKVDAVESVSFEQGDDFIASHQVLKRCTACGASWMPNGEPFDKESFKEDVKKWAVVG